MEPEERKDWQFEFRVENATAAEVEALWGRIMASGLAVGGGFAAAEEEDDAGRRDDDGQADEMGGL